MTYQFAQYQYLWLLLGVPLLIAGYGLYRALRKRTLSRLGDRQLVEGLMPSWSGAKGW